MGALRMILLAEADPQRGSALTLPASLVEALGDQAGDKAGLTWRVRVIRAGLSANGNEYPLDVLHKAAALFNEAKVLLRSDQEHVRDEAVAAERVIGWLSEATPSPEGVDATLNLTEDPLARDLAIKIRSAWQRGKKDLVGLSIVAEGIAHLRRVAGRTTRVVESILRVRSVDVVANPAAGGRILDLVAGVDPRGREEACAMWEKILKFLEAHDPEGYKKLDPQKVDEALAMQLYEAAVTNQTAKLAEAETKLAEAMKKPPADGKPPAENVQLTEALSGLREEIKQLKEARNDTEALRELRAMKFDAKLEELMAEAGLPEDSKDYVMLRLPADKRRADCETDIREAIKTERKLWAKRRGFSGPGSAFVEAENIVDESEKFVAALTGLFTRQREPYNVKKPKETVEPFGSLREAYVAFTGDDRVTGQMKHAPFVRTFYEAAQVLNAQWAYVLGDSITRAMMKAYREIELQEWRKIVDIVPVRDFRTQHRTQLGGFPTLSTVTAGNAYVGFTDVADDFEATYAVAKKGNTQDITLEMIRNDDVGAVRRIPGQIARAAKLTKSNTVWALITSNATLALSGDATALHTVAHGNTTAAFEALSYPAIVAGRTAMMKQTLPAGVDGTAGERLHINPQILWGSVDLEQTMFELTMALAKPLLDRSTASAEENEGIPSFIKNKLGLEYIVVPGLTDAVDWGLIANPASIPTIEMGCLDGREEPEVFVQDLPNVGSMFTNDKLTWKIRDIYGVVVCDFRGFYAQYN